ncbi:UNVERIFIED_CONTAM: hypothetical protein GTU68_024001 [Idotea baltica]|nr:hypothetical protein [Idotea baltica]
MKRNISSFDEVRLVPNGLANLSTIDHATTVLGQKIDWPIFLSPTAMTRLFHHDGEKGVARAAAKFGTMYSLSSLSTESIETIGALTDGPKCFQIYIHRDRGMTADFVERCKAAKFSALCLTIDTLVAGNRERDLVTGMTVPPKLTLKSLASFAVHPAWAYHFLTKEKFELGNIQRHMESDEDLSSVIKYANSQFDPSITWQDAEDLIQQWGGPFAIKGIMSVPDAIRARDAGASAIMVSNHGGRQLDGSIAPFDMLGRIVDAVGDDVEVILDSGVRRGTHVLKALAMGARASMMGRGYLYALAAGGQPGVERALDRMTQEIERDMILMGCASLADLNRSMLQCGSPLDTGSIGDVAMAAQ